VSGGMETFEVVIEAVAASEDRVAVQAVLARTGSRPSK
jgi:hypothetical protein